jgi:hypothetical protein
MYADEIVSNNNDEFEYFHHHHHHHHHHDNGDNISIHDENDETDLSQTERENNMYNELVKHLNRLQLLFERLIDHNRPHHHENTIQQQKQQQWIKNNHNSNIILTVYPSNNNNNSSDGTMTTVSSRQWNTMYDDIDANTFKLNYQIIHGSIPLCDIYTRNNNNNNNNSDNIVNNVGIDDTSRGDYNNYCTLFNSTRDSHYLYWHRGQHNVLSSIETISRGDIMIFRLQFDMHDSTQQNNHIIWDTIRSIQNVLNCLSYNISTQLRFQDQNSQIQLELKLCRLLICNETTDTLC